MLGKTLFSAGDVEGHVGLDGRYYLLDLARCQPPEDGQLCFHLNQHRDIFYRLLRPELLEACFPLSSSFLLVTHQGVRCLRSNNLSPRNLPQALRRSGDGENGVSPVCMRL